MTKHPIPLKRLRRRALGALAAVVVLAAVAAALGCGRLAPRAYEVVIPEKPGPLYELPVVTAPPAATAPPVPAETWTRYPVPLDDDTQRYIADVCADYGVDPALVYAIMYTETDGTFDASLVGDDGQSFGIMQIYRTQHLGRIARLGVTDLFDIRQNASVGVDLLAELAGHDRGLAWALSVYNGGWELANYYDAAGSLSPYAAEVLARAYELTAGAVAETEEAPT